jgi:mono/diheme cytochrome c family protein
VTRSYRCCALVLALLSWHGCTARPASSVPGIELPDPNEEPKPAAARTGASADAGLIASATGPSEQADEQFVYSRDPLSEQERNVPQLPIHINESWWAFRAQRLGITVEQAKKRDAEFSDLKVPADFWDAQTALETVSVWTVLCNECHGGRRSLADAAETPAPAATWGRGEGLFFGNRRTYSHMFNVVRNGGPRRENRREEMPAWRNILSTEMVWALLYFLEYQSGGIESRFPPSLYPRRPRMLDQPR